MRRTYYWFDKRLEPEPLYLQSMLFQNNRFEPANVFYAGDVTTTFRMWKEGDR